MGKITTHYHSEKGWMIKPLLQGLSNYDNEVILTNKWKSHLPPLIYSSHDWAYPQVSGCSKPPWYPQHLQLSMHLTHGHQLASLHGALLDPVMPVWHLIPQVEVHPQNEAVLPTWIQWETEFSALTLFITGKSSIGKKNWHYKIIKCFWMQKQTSNIQTFIPRSYHFHYHK